jgi:hypothetical protein
MNDVGGEDWQGGDFVVVPHAWRDDDLWPQIQATTQDHIGLNLRTMYSEMLQQPLSPALLGVAREIERRMTTS